MKFALPVLVLAACLLPLGAQFTPSASPATPNLAESAQVPAAAVPAPPSNPAAHTALTSDVMEALIRTATLSTTPITVNVTDPGDVSLNGVVTTQAQADAAVATVKAVPGVKNVKSQIVVDKDPFATAAPAAPAPSATSSLVGNGNDPQAKLDLALNAQAGLAQVASTVYANQVTLFGTVTSDKEKKQAEQIAKTTLPSYKLSNIIWVNPHPAAPAPMIPVQ